MPRSGQKDYKNEPLIPVTPIRFTQVRLNGSAVLNKVGPPMFKCISITISALSFMTCSAHASHLPVRYCFLDGTNIGLQGTLQPVSGEVGTMVFKSDSVEATVTLNADKYLDDMRLRDISTGAESSFTSMEPFTGAGSLYLTVGTKTYRLYCSK